MSLFATSGIWLTAMKLVAVIATLVYFFVRLFQGRVSMSWMRKRLWWWF